MAIMIPDQPPRESNYTESEREFWWDLKRQLGDEFFVYHSLPYLRADAKQGEIDFLVLHRHHGMLNIECKGSGVERDADGRWYRLDKWGRREPLRKTPTEQATAQIKHIVGGLTEPTKRALRHLRFREFPLVFGWALAFPKSRRGQINLPLSLQPEVIIDSGDIHDGLEEAVVAAMNFYAQKLKGPKRRLDPPDFKKLRAVISPPMKLPPVVDAANIDDDKRRIAELSERQRLVVRQILANRRVYVPGGAGTGKTVLALHAARSLAEQGEDVLLTCFNSRLADYLGGVVATWPELPGHVDVHHFHDLCTIANNSLGGVLSFPDGETPRKERLKFWREDTAFALMRAVDEQALPMGPWDAIIVDEGQDFAHIWWEVLEECLRSPTPDEPGRRVIFFDDQQAIFDHKPCVPTEGSKFPLFDNFRNTRAITEAVTQLVNVNVQAHAEAPQGEPPTVYQQPGPTKTRRRVGELIDDLVTGDRVDYDRMVILSPRSPKNSSLQAATALGEHPVVHSIDRWGEGVLHTTIGAFKGLEADVVILIDVDPDDPRCSPNARYVAASRAISRLHIFEKGHWLTC